MSGRHSIVIRGSGVLLGSFVTTVLLVAVVQAGPPAGDAASSHDEQSGLELVVQSGHNEWVTDVAVAAQRSIAATSAADETVRVWDIETGIMLRVFHAHADAVTAVALTHGAELVATGDDAGTIFVWDTATGQIQHELTGHSGRIHDLSFDPGGRWLASAANGGVVIIWSTTTGRPVEVLPVDANNARAVAFEPTRGSLIVTGTRGRREQPGLRWWSFDERRDGTVTLHELQPEDDSSDIAVTEVAFSADGDRLLARSRKSVSVFDVATRTRVARESAPELSGAAISPDGLLALADRPYVRVIDVGTGDEIVAHGDEKTDFTALAFGRDGARLVAGDAYGAVEIIETEGWRATTLHGRYDSPGDLERLAGARRASEVSNRNGAVIWNLAEARVEELVRAYRGRVWPHPDGRLYAVEEKGYTVDIRDAESGQKLTTIEGLDGHVEHVGFLPGAKDVVVVITEHATVGLWELSKGDWLQQMDLGGTVEGVVQGGPTTVVRLSDADLILVSEGSGTDGSVIHLEDRLRAPVFVSDDGTRIIARRVPAGRRTAELAMWRADDLSSASQHDANTPHWTLDAPPDLRPEVVSDDGNLLLAAARDSLYVIDAETGAVAQKLPGYDGAATFVDQGGSGELRVAAVHGDHLLRRREVSSNDVTAARPIPYEAITYERRGSLQFLDEIDAWAFSDDRTQVALGRRDGRVVVWKPETGVPTVLDPPSGSAVLAIVFDASAERIFVGRADGSLELWHTGRAELLDEVRGTLAVTALHLAPPQLDTPARLVVGHGSRGAMVVTRTPRELVQIYALETETPLSAGPILRLRRPPDPSGRMRVAENISELDLSPDGRTVVAATSIGALRMWDTETGAQTRQVPAVIEGGIDTPIESVAWSPDGRHIALAERLGDAVVLDAERWQEVRRITGQAKGVERVLWSPAGHLLTVSMDLSMREWNVETGALISSRSNPLDVAAYTPDGRELIDVVRARTIKVWRVRDGALLHTFLPRGIARAADLLHDVGDDRLISAHLDGTMRIWDLASGRHIADLASGAPAARELERVTQTMLLSRSIDDRLQLWNLADVPLAVRAADDLAPVEMRPAMTLLAAGRTWFVFTPDGHFDGSRHGGDMVKVVDGLDAYGVDQFAMTHNRPDVLLQRMGDLATRDAALHEHLRKQHQKRLTRFRRRLAEAGFEPPDDGAGGAGPLMDQLPSAEIVSTTAVEPNGRVVELDLRLEPDGSKLAFVQIYVDDVPEFEGFGRAIDGKEAGSVVRRVERIELTPGRHKLEVTAIDVRGREALRDLVIAEYTPEAEPPPGELYFVGLGVSRYADSTLDLGFAHKDAEDLARLLSNASGFDGVHVRVLTDEHVTRGSIRRMRTFLEHATIDDTVVLFIAGHGVYERSDEATYYYLTHEADLDDLANTAATFADIESLLSGLDARRKLFLMDTCASGDMAEERYASDVSTADARGLRPRTTRAVSIGYRAGTAPRRFLQDRDRFIYNDITRRTGAIVLSSSRGGELSYETADIANGMFTEAILEALTTGAADADESGTVSDDELRAWVSREVAEMSGGLQHPTVDRDNLVVDVELPVVAIEGDVSDLALPPDAREVPEPLPGTVDPGQGGCACALSAQRHGRAPVGGLLVGGALVALLRFRRSYR